MTTICSTMAPYGAILLAATMIRAVATHVLIVGGSALPALVLLAAMVAIARARREQLPPRAE
jgi:putative oxidoreductase